MPEAERGGGGGGGAGLPPAVSPEFAAAAIGTARAEFAELTGLLGLAAQRYGAGIAVDFRNCTVEWQPEHRRCVTRFPDGAEAYACPHDTDAYRKHAAEKSTGDVDLYCWQHDLCHVIVAMMNGRAVSAVLWALAHGESTDTPECELEELAAQRFQRQMFLRP